jgi:hypothetical protein
MRGALLFFGENVLDRPPPQVFVLKLETRLEPAAAVRALRAALKILNRRFNLRCVSVE